MPGPVTGPDPFAHDASPDDARSRGDDDVTGALGARHGQDRVGDVERAEEVGLHPGPELLGTVLLEGPGVEVPGMVRQRIDTPWRILGDVQELVSTGYGQLLLIKVCLVLLVVLVAG